MDIFKRAQGLAPFPYYIGAGCLEDLFQLILRPNKALISEKIYEAKTQKWKSKWPELTVVPW